MPRLDQTGPAGAGPMSGRGMGSCSGGMRQGFGCSRGQGRFAGRTYLSKTEEVEDLEDEAKNLEADLKALKGKIAEIKGE